MEDGEHYPLSMEDGEHCGSGQSDLDYSSALDVARWAATGAPISERSRKAIAAHAEREGGKDARRYVERVLAARRESKL